MEKPNTNNFLKLLMAHQKPIYAFILSMAANREDARDIFQETVLVMWSKFAEFEPDSNFAGWGIAIAKYKLLQAHRRRSKEAFRFSQAALGAIEAKSDQFLGQIDRRTHVLQQCIHKLSPRDHHLVSMRYEKEMDVKTIAAGFERSVQSVYKRFRRIHNILLECIRRGISREELT